MTTEAVPAAPFGPPKTPDPQARGSGSALGLLVPISLAAAVGLLVVAIADVSARRGASGAHVAFWLGLLVIVVPVAARLVSSRPTRAERLGLVIVFTVALYLCKVVYDPTAFSFSDEFVHWRSTEDILASGHLWHFNPLLPIASGYPGLAGVTSEVMTLTGLSASAAGFIIVGLARLILMVTLFLLFERLSHSPRIAALGCLLYAANPNFLYWDAQFAYESLALPLALLVIHMTLKQNETDNRRGWFVLSCIGIAAVVSTHHLSADALTGAFVVWSVLAILLGRGSPPIAQSFMAVIAVSAWDTFVPLTGQYLGGVFSVAGQGTLDVVTGHGGTRRLFATGASVTPMWERYLGLVSVALLLLALPIGLRTSWRRYIRVPLGLIAMGLALAYPVLLPLRFVNAAQETANRTSEYVYVGLGLVVATAAVAFDSVRRQAPRRIAIAVLVILIFGGGVTVSWQYSQRLSPPAREAGAPDALDHEATTAATWTLGALGPGRRFATDLVDRLALATYGRQRPLWAPSDGASSWQILLPPRVDRQVRAAVSRGHVEFVLVQRRLSTGIPSGGDYFDKNEPLSAGRRDPLSPAVLAKFDGVRGVDRLFDSGDIQIYRVAALGSQKGAR